MKDLLSIRDLPKDETIKIIKSASIMKKHLMRKDQLDYGFNGKTLITLFYEPSTRTRVSFEIAAKLLGMNAVNIEPSTSSIVKGESLKDTIKTLSGMHVDMIVMRHPITGAPGIAAKNTSASVINAGDGINEHPTQALLDLFTMMEYKGDIKGLKIAIIGDILHSRVARSNIYLLSKFGAKIHVTGPSTLIPPGLKQMGAVVHKDIKSTLEGADVVMTLRVQRERQALGFFPSFKEYFSLFGLNKERMSYAHPDAILMHPGPVNRGIEIDDTVDNVLTANRQVTNGVAVRMALIKRLAEANRRGGFDLNPISDNDNMHKISDLKEHAL